jgi:simple sugar transport system ATP-binding protein
LKIRRPTLDQILELFHITKAFPGVVANNDISLSFEKGEVHCLLGENGAGKTTLMNIVFGLYHPDSGEIHVRGKKLDVTSSAVAIQNGIGMVHQHFMLVNPLSVAENVVLGNEPPSRLVFRKDQAIQDVVDLSERYHLIVDPRAIIEDLPLGVRQRVEILKALYRNADILILDEPTAVLSPPEVEELYHTIASLKQAGKTIIFITHKLKETMAVSDRVTVLRDGEVVGTVPRLETSPQELARMMVGREVVLRVNKQPRAPGEEMLRVTDLKVVDNRGLSAVQGISFSLRAGEIYGIAGIEGNGQTELVEALTGLRKVQSGKFELLGVELTHSRPAAVIHSGIGHVPEDRNVRGLVGSFTIAENLVLGYHRQTRFQSYGVIRGANTDTYATQLVESYNIRTPGINTLVSSLSGGNQQKVVLARVFNQKPKVLVVAQPTRGVDVGATEYIHQQMLQMRQEGAAILLISADLDEIRSLSDRIAVIFQGRLVSEKAAGDYTEEELGLLMAGMGKEHAIEIEKESMG